VRNGFDDLFDNLEHSPGWLKNLIAPKSEGLNNWQRIRKTCEELGPTFVKFAQLLSSRPDVLPQALIEELKQLRDRVSTVAFEEIKPSLEEELGMPIDECFDSFDTTAVAAGSIGQIYKARLKSENALVAVKVQRPHIRKAVEADLEIIGWLAKIIHERFEEVRPFDIQSVVEEAKQGLYREMDFNNESRNTELFNSLNTFPDDVYAPKVFKSYTAKGLMITEWVEGSPPDKIEADDLQKKKLAQIGGCSIFHQIFIAGFFHADPHSGNMLVTPEGKIVFIDWGLTGQLTRKMRYFLADLLGAIQSGSPENVVHAAVRMSRNNRYIDTMEMEKQVRNILLKYRDLKLGSGSIGRLILDMLFILGSNGIQLTKDYTLLARTVASIEEIGHDLDPEFDLVKTAEPFIRELTMERWKLSNLIKNGSWFAYSWVRILQELPGDIQRLARRLEQEDLMMQVHHRGLENLERTLGSAANRLVLGLIIGALIIGSSLIITSGVGPRLWDIPSIGLLGYLISALLGFWIIVDILRHGRHK